MRLNFLNLTVKNFLSVGNVTQSIKFDTNGLTLILGNNADVQNGKNGVGKSSILTALTYVLFGEPITNIKLDNLINAINEKGMMVTLDFEVDKIPYRIERGRKPNIFKFYKNNKEESDSLGENKHTQEEINRLIGMDHTLFCHIVVMNTYTVPFLKMKAAEQREVIERLLGILTLSERDEKLVEIIKETKRLLKEEEITIKAIGDSNARIQIAIDKALNESHSWQVAWKANLSKLQDALETMAGINFDEELIRFDEIDTFNEEFAAISASIKEEQKETISLQKELARTISLKIDLERDLSKIPTSHVDRLKAEAKRCQIESEKDCEEEIKKLQDQIGRCQKEAERTQTIRYAEILKIEAQIARRKSDADKKIKASEEKVNELTSILAEIDNSDGHTCSTCGQNIDGTDHLEKIISNLQKKAEILEKAIEKDISDSISLEAEADDLLAEIEKVKNDCIENEKTWSKEIEKLNDQISHFYKNHSSLQEEWKIKAAEIQKEIVAAELEISSQKELIQEKINDIENQIIEIKAVISEREDLEKVYLAELEAMKISAPKPITYSSREEVWKAREKFNTLEGDYKRESEKENPHEAYVESLRQTLQVVNYDNLNLYQDDLKHQEFVHKLLTAKDSFIRKKIIDRNLYLLNQKIGTYLHTLGLPHEVKFKPDLTVDITHMGRDFDFEQLSRGEMNRVILAVSWSFRDIWEDLNKNINLIFLDEIADNGLDQTGTSATLGILEKMAHQKNKSVFLISHKEELIGQVDKILVVHKEEGFTRFEYE